MLKGILEKSTWEIEFKRTFNNKVPSSYAFGFLKKEINAFNEKKFKDWDNVLPYLYDRAVITGEILDLRNDDIQSMKLSYSGKKINLFNVVDGYIRIDIEELYTALNIKEIGEEELELELIDFV